MIKTYNVKNPPNSIRKNKLSFRKHIASPQTVHCDRNTIRNIQHDDGSRDNGVESAGRAEKDASEDDDQDDGEV